MHSLQIGAIMLVGTTIPERGVKIGAAGSISGKRDRSRTQV
jgi:hypothetical protein